MTADEEEAGILIRIYTSDKQLFSYDDTN